MKNEKTKWMLVVYGITLMFVGVLTTVFALVNPGVINNVISISVGVGLCVVGAMHLVTALITKTSEFFTAALLLGSIAIACGVVFFIKRDLISQFLIYFVGVFLLSIGVVSLVKSILFIIYKQKGSWITFYIILTALAITLGVLALVYSGEAQKILYAAVGIGVTLTGIGETIYGIRVLTGDAKPKDK